MKILKYKEHKIINSMVSCFVDNFNDPVLTESVDFDVKSILKSLSKDLKFNFILISRFGFGITAIYPIIENLIKNGNLNIDMSPENIILITLASLSIAYLDESNNKSGNSMVDCGCLGKDDCEKCSGSGKIKSDVSKKDAQTLLEELKLRGVGNGIVKKLVLCIKSISSIIRSLFEKSPFIIKGLIDMIGYTSLLVPTMNAMNALVGKYELNMDTLPSNFLSLGIGVVSFLAKNGINYLIKKLKNKVNISKKEIDISKDDEYQILDISPDITDKKGELIKEQ